MLLDIILAQIIPTFYIFVYIFVHFIKQNGVPINMGLKRQR